MKFAKKLASTLLIAALFITTITLTSAETPLDDVDELVPENTFALIKFNPYYTNSTIQNLYSSGLDYARESGVISSDILDAMEDEEVTIGAFTDSTGQIGALIIIEITRTNFDSIITNLGSSASLVDSTAGDIYLDSNSSSYLSYIGEYFFVISNSQTAMEDIHNSWGRDTILHNDKYTDTRDSFLDDNFLNLYFDFDYISEMAAEFVEEDTALDVLKSAGLSSTILSDGFQIEGHTETDSSALTSLGIDYSDSMGIPSMYTHMPSSNPIFFLEGFNLRQSWDAMKAMDSTSSFATEIEDGFKSSTGLDITNNIMPLLENGAAILIQDNDELFPSVTGMFEIVDNTDLAELLINGLVEIVWAAISDAPETTVINDNTLFVEDEGVYSMTITKEIVSKLGGNLNQFTVEIEQQDSDNPYSMELPSDLLEFVITIGVTEDDLLLISSNKDITEEYDEGLDNNNDFYEVFDAKYDEIYMIEYFNMDNLGDYINQTLSTIISSNSDKDTEAIEEARDSVSDFFGIFNDLYVRSEKTNDYSNSETTFRLDFDKLEDLWTKVTELWTTAPSGYSTYTNSQKEFADFEEGEWYSDDVYYLTSQGIVTGYGDGSYGPGNEITRAEFITMIIRSLNEKGYFEDSYDTCNSSSSSLFALIDTSSLNNGSSFTDVGSYDWFAPYICTAKAEDIISGYDDGSFKPNNPISRAEAVQIISNAINAVDAEESELGTDDFNDISSSDWYYGAVIQLNGYEIVEGTGEGNFEPNRSINRAESAKIIRRSLDIIR